LPNWQRTPRPEKVQEITELVEILESELIIFTDFQGMDVKSLSKVRAKLRETGGGYRVAKNTLLRRAAPNEAAKQLTELLRGSTAVAYTQGDPVAAAKALMDFTKGQKTIKIKSGIVEGQVLDASQVEALSKVPPRDQLIAMVVGGLQSPITNLVGTLQSMFGQLVMTCQAIADQKAA
jgi:large subunit ribosomal protein L10